MLGKIVGAGALLAAGIGLLSGHRGMATEEAEVRAALQHYLNGHATGNADEFRQAMYPKGTMQFIEDGQYTAMSLADYVARAESNPHKPAADEAKRKRRIEMVDVTGNVAIG